MAQYIIFADHVQMLFSTDNLSVLSRTLQNVTIPNVNRLHNRGHTQLNIASLLSNAMHVSNIFVLSLNN